MRFLAEPRPDAAAAVTRNAGLAGQPPPRPPSAEGSTPELAVAEAIVAIETLTAAAEKRLKGAGIRARWVGFDQRVHVARVGRPVVADQRRSGRLRLEISLVRKGRSARAVGESVAHLDRASPAQGLVEQLAEAVATRAEQRLAAEAVTSGERPVVFAPGVGGVLFHELVGHALEADTVRRRASWLARGNQEYRAAAELMVLDDPRRCRAPWRVDDEGEVARPTPLMREGRAVGLLHDLASARSSDQSPTGHGRRAGFREPVRPRMGCTFLAAGRYAPGDALEGIDDGVYVRRMEAASTDTLTGAATFRVSDADRIRHGRIVAPLAPHIIHIDGQAALASVERVAGDLEFDTCIGSCLHHGQPLSVSVGAPTFRIGSTVVVS